MNAPAGDPPDLGALADWAPELARTFVSLASDIALVIDSGGVIRNVAQGGADPLAPGAYQWIGRPWIDTVSGENRGKIEMLLSEAGSKGIARKREVNHPFSGELSIPVAYTAIRLGEHGPVLAVGRDLRAIAAIQQRFIESQQDLERGYWKARQAESRYRLLFQVATDGVLVVNAETFEILEANQSCAQLFDVAPEQLLGRAATFGFERHSRSAIETLLATARGTGQSGEIPARLMGRVTPTSVAATPFRADDAMRLLVRVRAIDAPHASNDLNATLARLVDGASDGVVVTDSSGRILVANPAFLALVHLGAEADVKGRALDDWLGGDEGETLGSMFAQVRNHGLARRREVSVRPARAPSGRIEISATLLTEGDQECIGFTMRRIADRPAPLPAPSEDLRRGIELLAERLGEAALPELLRQSTALAERFFLQLAIERAGGEVAATSALLGLSPSSVERRKRRLARAPRPPSSLPDA